MVSVCLLPPRRMSSKYVGGKLLVGTKIDWIDCCIGEFREIPVRCNGSLSEEAQELGGH